MITVRPYMHNDGVPSFRDSDVLNLYDLMERDGTSQTVFISGDITNRDQFLQIMKSPTHLLFIAMKEQIPFGCGWMNGFEGKMARAHFCFFREGLEYGSFEVGMEMVKTAIKMSGVDMLVGMVPTENQQAIKFAQKCGAELCGVLPYGTWDAKRQKSISTTVLYYTE